MFCLGYIYGAKHRLSDWPGFGSVKKHGSTEALYMRILVLLLIEDFLQRALSLPTTADALASWCIRSLRIDPSFERIEQRCVNSSTISAGLSPTIRTGGGAVSYGLNKHYCCLLQINRHPYL